MITTKKNAPAELFLFAVVYITLIGAIIFLFMLFFYFFQLRRPSQEIADDGLNNFEHTNYCQI